MQKGNHKLDGSSVFTAFSLFSLAQAFGDFLGQLFVSANKPAVVKRSQPNSQSMFELKQMAPASDSDDELDGAMDHTGFPRRF